MEKLHWCIRAILDEEEKMRYRFPPKISNILRFILEIFLKNNKISQIEKPKIC